jgi:hypothetical protein
MLRRGVNKSSLALAMLFGERKMMPPLETSNGATFFTKSYLITLSQVFPT